MGEFVVLKGDDWQPKISSSILTAPKLKISISLDDAAIKAMPPKQRKVFDDEFKRFQSEFAKLRAAKVKTIDDAVKWTEPRIRKNPVEANRKEVLDTANKLLAQGFKAFEGEIEALAKKVYDAAVAKSFQAMKEQVKKAQFKAIVKVVILTGLAVTAAYIATVATLGAAPALIAAFGILVAGSKAGYKTYLAYKSHWINAEKARQVVEKDIANLLKASTVLESQEKQRNLGKAGAEDKYKQVAAVVSGKMVDLDKHVGQLDKFVAMTQQTLTEQTTKLTELMRGPLEKTKSAKATADAEKVQKSIDESKKVLDGLAAVRVKADAAKLRWDKTQKLDLSEAARQLQQSKDAGAVMKRLGQAWEILNTTVSGQAQAAGAGSH